MTDSKADKKDPTIKSDSIDTSWPEGTHPALPASEVTHSADRFEYRDLPDDRKPDASTVAQEQILPDDPA